MTIMGDRLLKFLCRSFGVDEADVNVVVLRCAVGEVPVLSVNGRDAYVLAADPSDFGVKLCNALGVEPTQCKSLRLVARRGDLATAEVELQVPEGFIEGQMSHLLSSLERHEVAA